MPAELILDEKSWSTLRARGLCVSLCFTTLPPPNPGQAHANFRQGLYRKILSKFTNFFTNLCNMAQKSNTKVCNSSAHLVKGHNPYCS